MNEYRGCGTSQLATAVGVEEMLQSIPDLLSFLGCAVTTAITLRDNHARVTAEE